MRFARVLRLVRGSLLVLIAAGWAAPRAEAQQFGQWWWVASATASGQQITADSRGGGRSNFGSDRLRFRFGVRGFIVHPAIGEFRADVDASASRVSGGRSIDTDQVGFDIRLELLRYGYFPISLYARQSFFDYGEPADGSSFTLTSAPDRQRVWGALISSRWKGLRGFKLRLLESEIDFVDPELGREVTEEQELIWSKYTGPIGHSARLSRRYLEYPIGDFAAEDLLLALEQSGRISPRWHWRQSLGGTRRSLPQESGADATETLVLSSQLRRRQENNNQLRFLLSASAARSPANEVRSAGLRGEYSFRQGTRWTISPNLGYSQTRLDDETISSAQGGLNAAWSWRRGSRSLTLFNGVGYLVTDSDRAGTGSADSDAFTYELRVSVGNSPPQGLGRHLELTLFHNDIVTSEPIDPESIDFGLVVNRNLLVDSLTGRLTLDRTWQKLQASSNTFWTRRESSSTARPETATGPAAAASAEEQGFRSDNLSQVFQISREPFDFSATLASSWVSNERSAEQRADLLTGTLRWRPYRPLNLYLRYRADERDTALAPRRDYQRFEAGLDFSLGRLSVEASYFETFNKSGPARERTNRGVRWRVTRRAAGLLPIVSAPKRRGVIR